MWLLLIFNQWSHFIDQIWSEKLYSKNRTSLTSKRNIINNFCTVNILFWNCIIQWSDQFFNIIIVINFSRTWIRSFNSSQIHILLPWPPVTSTKASFMGVQPVSSSHRPRAQQSLIHDYSLLSPSWNSR